MQTTPIHPDVLGCPSCGHPCSTHHHALHHCSWPGCDGYAQVECRLGASRSSKAVCERHLRARLVEAERFGRAIVVQRLPHYQPPLWL